MLGTRVIGQTKIELRKLKFLIADTFYGLPIAALVIFIVSTLFSVLVYNQGDLTHTTKSSFTFLDGHFFDFYDENKIIVGGNDYFPVLYLIFALWFVPLKLMGFASADSLGISLLPIEIFWAKSLLAVFLFATFLIVNLISRELFPKEKKRQKVVIFSYLLSPFALFAATIFGQYDVIGVFFTLLGFLYYLRGNTTKFVIFFAIAISLKFFAFIIFVPLVLLKYKEIRKILLLFILSATAIAIQLLVFSGSPAFRESAFRLVSSKTGGAASEQFTIFVSILFMIGCFYLWRVRPNPEAFAKYAVFAASTAYGLMFEVVVWHPQWIIILTPFFAMAVGYFNRPSAFILWDTFVFLAFVWLIVNWWMYNVDNLMIERGPFASFFNHHQLILSDIYVAERTREFKVVLTFFFISPIAYLLFEHVSKKYASVLKLPNTWVWVTRASVVLVVWTIPTLFAFLVPLSIAKQITAAAPSYSMTSETIGKNATAVTPELIEGDIFEQSFIASQNKLAGISIRAATYFRTNEGVVSLSLKDENSIEIASMNIEAAQINEQKKIFMWFEPIFNSEGKPYSLTISSLGNTSKQMSISLWLTPTDDYRNGEFQINGELVDGDLDLTAYYE